MKKLWLPIIALLLLTGCGKEKVSDLPQVITADFEDMPEVVPVETPAPTITPESMEQSISVSEVPEEIMEPESTPLPWNDEYAAQYFGNEDNFTSNRAVEGAKDTIHVNLDDLDMYVPLSPDDSEWPAFYDRDSNIAADYMYIADNGRKYWKYYIADDMNFTDFTVVLNNGNTSSIYLAGSNSTNYRPKVSIDGITLLTTPEKIVDILGTPTSFTSTGEHGYYTLVLEWNDYNNYSIMATFSIKIIEGEVREDHLSYLMIDVPTANITLPEVH